jgi:polysaccharide export outer membrane protein
MTMLASALRRARLLAPMGACVVAGCASQPPVTVRALPSPVVQRRAEVLDAALVQAVVGEREGEAYRVGPGDSLVIAVYGHPELSLAQYAGVPSVSQSMRGLGLVIDTDGTIQLPLIGSVLVSGKSTDQIRKLLEEQLALFIKEPKVTVQIAFNGSIRYYLLGHFTNPGMKYSDRPMRLLEALSLGGSIDLEHASLRSAYVARGNRRLPINFRKLLSEGDLRQNIHLRSGDIVFVPDNGSEQAFVFGGAFQSNPKGGAVPFTNGRLDLVQALVAAGFGFRERAQTVLSETRVIRSEGDRGELFVVNVEKILDGDAAPFPLEPGDIVFVPRTALATWAQTIEQFVPTLQAVGGVLTPFVQIKYLRSN